MLMEMRFCSPPYKRFGQGERRLGLAGAAGADEHEDADGPVGIVEPGAAGLDAAGDGVEGMALADDAASRAWSASLRTCSISFFTMRPTGMPVQSATTLAMALASTLGKDERRLALELLSVSPASSFNSVEQLSSRSSGARAASCGVARPCPAVISRRPAPRCVRSRAARSLARSSRILRDAAPSPRSSAFPAPAKRFLLPGPACPSISVDARLVVDADGGFAIEDLQFGFQAPECGGGNHPLPPARHAG